MGQGEGMTGVAVAWKKPKYVVEDTDRHGTMRIYVWKKGTRKIRLRQEIDTPEWWKAYTRALDGIPTPIQESQAPPVELSAPGSFRWLCEKYYTSIDFRELDATTRQKRRAILESCWFEPTAPGSKLLIKDCPISKFASKHVKMLRDRKFGTPDAANGRIKALRRVFKWAIQDEDIAKAHQLTVNPAREVILLKTSGEGFHTWTREEVEQYERVHRPGTMAYLALALVKFTGVRKSDLVRLGRQHLRSDVDPETDEPQTWIKFTAFKNRNRKAVTLQLPVLPELLEAIKQSPCGHLTFLVTENGKPFTLAGFGNRMRKWCDAAGLPLCTTHGVRKAGATTAAENGATEAQLMAIYGWSDPDMAALYTKKARQKKIAGDAMHLVVHRQPARKRDAS